jgi:hypothetical protein
VLFWLPGICLFLIAFAHCILIYSGFFVLGWLPVLSNVIALQWLGLTGNSSTNETAKYLSRLCIPLYRLFFFRFWYWAVFCLLRYFSSTRWARVGEEFDWRGVRRVFHIQINVGLGNGTAGNVGGIFLRYPSLLLMVMGHSGFSMRRFCTYRCMDSR